jgi:hypothetical protein
MAHDFSRASPFASAERCARCPAHRELNDSPKDQPYFASGFGLTWNFAIFGLVPLPPSWCQGVYIE